MKRISQKEAIFWTLYKRFKAKDASYVPVHQLMGEVFCEQLNRWGYVSYEVSARASEMIKDNPGLIMRTWLSGRSGAKYYGYRFSPDANANLIKDEKLLVFYRSIADKKTALSDREQILKENIARVREFDKMP